MEVEAGQGGRTRQRSREDFYLGFGCWLIDLGR
jgi:hypothetical protein